jgi:phosphoribosylamine---glycine ligase
MRHLPRDAHDIGHVGDGDPECAALEQERGRSCPELSAAREFLLTGRPFLSRENGELGEHLLPLRLEQRAHVLDCGNAGLAADDHELPGSLEVDSAPVNILLIGSGAREHALAWRLAASPSLSRLHAAPGNPGIAALGDCHPVRADDTVGLLELGRALDIELVVVGPEAPLVAGIADELRRGGMAVFGPGAEAAQIEGSKRFAKDVMARAGVSVAGDMPIAAAPCVIKADGLAAGKGVFVCRTQDEVEVGLQAAAGLGGKVVIEELLEGREVSLFALCDGTRAIPLGTAQDYKRARDDNEGPNTGGMGAMSPIPLDEDPAELVARIHQPVVDELARRGTPFVGCLFAGLMLTADGVRVLEFNARFGDPETQVLIPRLEGDLLAALAAAARGGAEPGILRPGADAAVTVVLTGPDYPARSDYAGAAISGIADAQATGALVFHGGTAMRGDTLVTNGGRILSVTALGPDIPSARQRAYDAVEKISFDGARHRTDIAAAASI